MPLRSLVFSSDRGTAQLLGEALAELAMEVEHCPEIFGAIERLTLQVFDVIVVDWGDEPEASFLLRAARELKSNQPPYPVAVVEAQISAEAARRAGASQVFIKSQVRDDLLQLHPENCAAAPTTLWGDIEPGRDAPDVVEEQTLLATFSETARAGMAKSDSRLFSFAGYALGADARTGAHRNRAKWPRRVQSRQACRRGLAFTALVVAIFVSVWRLGPVLRPSLHAVASIRHNAGSLRAVVSSEIAAWFRPSPIETADEASPATILAADNHMQPPPPLLRPAHAAVLAPPGRTPSGAQLAESVAPTPAASSFAVGESLSEPIPESLKRPPELLGVRPLTASFTPSLLSALEPVLVPEEISRKLLLQKIPPSYPEQALRAGLQGPVVLQAWIGRDGRIRDLKLVRGYLVLGRAAFEAVKQWRYQPYYLNGRAMETQTYITVNFSPGGLAERTP